MKTIACLIVLLVAASSNPLPKANWYSVKFQSLCEELERNVTPEHATKYGTLKAFRIRQDSIAVDTIRVSFDFISNCCETHAATATLVNDTLHLEYYKTKGSETCRCLCDYRFTYSITDTTKRWSGIKINRLDKKN